MYLKNKQELCSHQQHNSCLDLQGPIIAKRLQKWNLLADFTLTLKGYPVTSYHISSRDKSELDSRNRNSRQSEESMARYWSQSMDYMPCGIKSPMQNSLAHINKQDHFLPTRPQ